MELKKPLLVLFSSLLLVSAPMSTFAAEKAKAKANPKPKQPDLQLVSDAAILYDMNLHKVIYEKNADKIAPTASLAKVMTLSIASDALASKKVKPDDKVLVSEKAWKTGGSKMFIEIGQHIPFGELFKGVAIVSGNDAAVAISEYLAGSTDNFVKKMNAKATSLGMKNTHYVSVNGLPQPELKGVTDTSTPRDLLFLAKDYLTKYEGNLRIHSLKEYTTHTRTGDITQKSENPLLGTYPGADGLKTGYIDNHYNLIGTAKWDGIRLIIVTMTAPDAKSRAKDAKTLLDYGFGQYYVANFGKAGDKVDKIPVYKSKVKKVDVILKNNVDIVMNKSMKQVPKVKTDIPSYLVGGKKKGDVIGHKYVYLGKKLIKKEDIILNEDLPKAGLATSFFDSIALAFKWISDKFA